LGTLVLTTAIVVLCTALPLTTDWGKEAAFQQQISQMEAFGMQVSDQMYDRMRQGMGAAPYTTGGTVLVAAPLIAVVISALLWAVFNAAMGGDASFKQIFAIVVHAGVISALGAIFTAAINVARGTMASSAANLSVLLPMVDEKSFLGRLLGMMDFFLIWWIFVLAVGLAVLYKRRTQPIAIALFGAYAVIALIVSTVMSRLGGGA
jgi:hypothetical protein